MGENNLTNHNTPALQIMKITKTVEIDVCDICKTKNQQTIVCPSCSNEVCANCVALFSVEVRLIKAPYVTRTEFLHPSCKYKDEVSYKGRFCSQCSSGFEQLLVEEGLEKERIKPIEIAVLA
jgi:hypothetical protein